MATACCGGRLQALPDAALVFQLKVAATALVADQDSDAQLARQADQANGLPGRVLRGGPVLASPPPGFPPVAGHHEGLAWWNFAFLFTITAMPFTSSLLGGYGHNPLAVDIFALNVLLAALATLVFGQRRDVLTGPADGTEDRVHRARVAMVVIALAVSVGLARVNTSAAKYCFLFSSPGQAPWQGGCSRY